VSDIKGGLRVFENRVHLDRRGIERKVERSFVICTLCQVYNDQVEEDEMSGAYSMSGGEKRNT
jgi:hypothetical protein